jgi:hypothetical protein
VASNRKYIIHVIKIIHFLAKQGIAFRGHNENKNQSKNVGNFLELLQFHQSFISDFELHSKSTVSYTSPKIQNEIINLISKQNNHKLFTKLFLCDYLR